MIRLLLQRTVNALKGKIGQSFKVKDSEKKMFLLMIYLMEETKNGHIPIRTPDHVESIDEIQEIHPYLAFHVVLPIPPILKFNHQNEFSLNKRKNTKSMKK